MFTITFLQGLVITLILTHITIVSVTLYLHRAQAHRGVEFHPVLAHFFRFWLWLTTGMTTKAWVAVHRKHHQNTDVEGDPHSPHLFGIKRLLLGGWSLYHEATKDPQMVIKYGMGTPKDSMERFYTRYHRAGFLLMLAIDVLLFGVWGILIWGIQMLWIPFWAAGFINGIGHWWGYRNGHTEDHSRNIGPVGILIGGEELHNNHHLDPACPKFSRKWFEFDIGWLYIKLLSYIRLAKIRTTNPV
jgi:stearoyl-CoA desaturase (Delta-9 desaturase)